MLPFGTPYVIARRSDNSPILFDVCQQDIVGTNAVILKTNLETLTSSGDFYDSENEMPSKYRHTIDR